MTALSRGARFCLGAVPALLLAAAPGARAQGLPSEPLAFGNGRVTVGGDVSVTFGCAMTVDQGNCADDTGFFNYTDYDHSTLREVRLDINAVVQASRRVAVLAEIRTENGLAPEPYALYLRVRPWNGNFDVQFGRIPPTFGAFTRRSYPNDNPLIGYPLGYQYLTSLHADGLPANADELLRMRGRGWLSNFTLGNTTPAAGLALVNALKWDTGVQVHGGLSWVDATAAVTTGSLGNPLVRDDNSGKQTAGRITLHPVAGLIVGASAASGPFLAGSATTAAGADGNASFTQRAWGTDVEFSRDYYLVRVETIHSRWNMPTLSTPLEATSTAIEGRYKIRPGVHVAARFDRLDFSDLAGTDRTDSWDAPVRRFELGAGYLLRRNLQLKASFQRNVRDGGRVRDLNIFASQLVFWL